MILCLLLLVSLIASVTSTIVMYKRESWSNTYSGWPGPIENPYATNIPALYGNPKYMSKWDEYERPLDKVIACCNEMKAVV